MLIFKVVFTQSLGIQKKEQLLLQVHRQIYESSGARSGQESAEVEFRLV